MDVVKIARVEAGIVVNVTLHDAARPIPEGAIALTGDQRAGPGWFYDGETFSPPDEPEPEPDPQAVLLDALADQWEDASSELRAAAAALRDQDTATAADRTELGADAIGRAAQAARQSARAIRGE